MEYRQDLLKLFDSNISEAEAICTMVVQLTNVIRTTVMLINNIICTKKVMHLTNVIRTTVVLINNIICTKIVQIAVVIRTTKKIYNLV